MNIVVFSCVKEGKREPEGRCGRNAEMCELEANAALRAVAVRDDPRHTYK